MSSPNLDRLWTPPLGPFADTLATRAGLARLQMSAQVIEMLAAAVPGRDAYMEITGQSGPVEFWRLKDTGRWHVPAEFGE